MSVSEHFLLEPGGGASLVSKLVIPFYDGQLNQSVLYVF